jgi:hypothetical protein
MSAAERDHEEVSTEYSSPTEEGPALRDAAQIMARAVEDEAAAAHARNGYQTEGLPLLEPDATLAPELRPGERLHVRRESALLNGPKAGPPLPGYAGTLYLTSERLVHIGQIKVSVDLNDIHQLTLAGERLLVTLTNGEGLSIDASQPRLLRVEIAAARSARR